MELACLDLCVGVHFVSITSCTCTRARILPILALMHGAAELAMESLVAQRVDRVAWLCSGLAAIGRADCMACLLSSLPKVRAWQDNGMLRADVACVVRL